MLSLPALLLRLHPPTPPVGSGRVHLMDRDEAGDASEEKQCSKCKDWKTLDQFYYRAREDRYSSWCRTCDIAAQKAKPKKGSAT